MTRSIEGIHHITAIAGEPERNILFYTRLLGLRLVKITVNFDDPASYHFYYGDRQGNPGTVLTFFSWPGAPRGRVGNGQLTATSFAIPPAAGEYWRERLETNGIELASAEQRFGETVISFVDPDGLRLELIETPSADRIHVWSGSEVPVDAAIRGFHSATLSETGYERTGTLLTETMDLRLIGNEQNRFRYEIGEGGPSKVIDVICAPGGVEGRVAVGTVHHIAWRTPNDAQQLGWLGELSRLGYNLSPVMDRIYFHSIYYREPGGILFEIATDPPGFTLDEPVDQLGTALKLPPWLESRRNEIEASLPVVAILKKDSRR
jgi:glyoxalase family protein